VFGAATDKLYINGTQLALGANIGALVTNINAAAGPDGLTATQKGDNIILSGAFTEVTFRVTAANGTSAGTSDIFGAAKDGSAGAAAAIEVGGIRLDSTANQPISIELGDSANVISHGFLEANVGAADFEVNDPTLGVSAGSTVAGLSVSTGSSAAKAIETLDNAINKVDAIRSELGALNNRLDYTVTNLSNIVLNTQAAKSQIMDADFSVETTRLTKAQILTQAATSMLAQANQSKQSILTLLQQ
jgi:flagellin